MHKIICKQVPEALLKREAAKNHFRKFGSVKRIVLRTSSRIITVEYLSEEAIEKVLKDGNVYENKKFVISKEQNIGEKRQNKKAKSLDEHLNMPDEVMEELNAMGGGPSLALVNKSNVRREVVNKEKTKKALKRRGPIDKEKSVIKKTKSVVYPENNEYQELLEILNQRAFTVEEKYKVLDARDKILRMLQKNNGADNGFTKGTCPDMCPEKERLLRVIQHQVSYYEQNANRELDPSLAVKQYSRSSADQESPLPHELRPVDVLQKTMSYLIHMIMPLGDIPNVNIGDWFHFIWDRTRSIRKDITQQELCCPKSVELIEQCARFHIHCSSRLVAEDPSVFDQKINTENLTKCLQTLKYMYHDLRLKGVKCPNEAEFRAYIILLNLNDSNFMWEVQGLPAEIQSSPQVKEAIEIYLALNSDNYIKFFKLVRRTSYLKACVLMRYFMQVRIRAIDIMLKCFTPRVTKVVYPLETLTENLGFESIDQTVEFVQNCGLQEDESRMSVTLDKSASIAEGLTYAALDRSINLVESKRGDSSLGEVVFGGKPPNFEIHTPKSSFNDEGQLEKQVFTVEDLEETENKSANEKVPDLTTEEVPEPSEPIEDLSEDQNEECVSSEHTTVPLIDETDQPETSIEAPIEMEVDNRQYSQNSIFDIAHPPVNSTQLIFGNKLENFGIFGGKNTNLPEIKQEVQQEQQSEEETHKIRKTEEIPPFEAKTKVDVKSPSIKGCSFMHQPIYPTLDLSTDKHGPWDLHRKFFGTGEEKKSKENKQTEEKTRSIVESILKEVVGKVVCISTMEKLEKLKSRVRKRLMLKFVNKWRQYIAKKKRQRKALNLFPEDYICRSLEEGAAEYSLLSNMRRNSNLNKGWYHETKEKKADYDWLASNLTNRYRSLGVKKSPGELTKIYWKAIISLPYHCFDSGHTHFMQKTLEYYLQWRKPDSPHVVQRFGEASVVRFCFSIEIGEGDAQNDANGLIFIGKSLNPHLCHRIITKFSTTGLNCSIPVAIILEEPSIDDGWLQSLLDQGIILAYLILSDYKKYGLENLLEKGIDFLLKKASEPPPIIVDYFENVLFKYYLSPEAWKKVTCSSGTNPAFRDCLKNPNVVFKLYNDGLKRLKEIVLDKSCFEYGRFAEEFRQFEEAPEGYPCDYKHLPDVSEDEEYFKFVRYLLDVVMPIECFSSWPPNDYEEFKMLIREFSMSNSGGEFEDFNRKLTRYLLHKVNDDLSELKDIMWTEVLGIIFAEKLLSYKNSFAHPMPNSWHYYNNLLVVYHKASFEDFLSMEWLNVSHPVIQKALNYDVDFDKFYHGDDYEKYISDESDADDVIAKAERALRLGACQTYDFDIGSFDEQMEDLSRSLTVSRRVTSRFHDHFEEIMRQE